MGCVASEDKYSNKATDWTVRGIRSLYGKEIILFSKTCLQGLRINPIQWRPGFFSPREENGRGVKLSTQLHLELSLRITRATIVLSLHAFMLWTRKNFTVAHVGVLSKSSPVDAVGSFTGCQATEARS
jgi:hypothetical protein